MRKSQTLLLATAALGFPQPASALIIELDYTYDTQGFFNQPGSKETLRKVADFFEDLIIDELDAIDPGQHSGTWTARPRHPGTGASLSIVNKPIPANTIIIYVGGRDLGGGTTGQASTGWGYNGSQAYFDAVIGRGQSGALGPDGDRTDYSVNIASISFDIDRTWNFGESNAAGSEFISTAIHEFLHVFGVGQSDSWDNLIDNSGNFTGTNAMSSYGEAVPLDPVPPELADVIKPSHWRSDSTCTGQGEGFDPDNPDNVLSKKVGVFSQEHGADQIAIMDPGRCDNGRSFAVITDLDLASLADIGWELSPPLMDHFSVDNSGYPTLSWNTLTPFTYRVHRGIDLKTFSPLSTSVVGNTSSALYSDTNPPAQRAFYRIFATPRYQPTQISKKSPSSPKSDPHKTVIISGGRTTSCSCSHSH